MNLLEQEPQPSTPSYREIILTQGQVALVDASDYDWLNQWKWCAMWCEKMKSFYALRRKNRRAVLMHRAIMGLEYGDKREVDHKESGQTLDNRRSNLRIATVSENRCNKRLQKNNTSGFSGVDFQRGKWRARVKKNKREFTIGWFATLEEAVEARRQAARIIHGEFASPT